MKRKLMVGLFVCLLSAMVSGCSGYTMSATSGKPTDLITITGPFTPTQGRTFIFFGDIFIGCAEEWTATSITLYVPEGYPVGDTVTVKMLLPDDATYVVLGEFTYTGLHPEGLELAMFLYMSSILGINLNSHGVPVQAWEDAAITLSYWIWGVCRDAEGHWVECTTPQYSDLTTAQKLPRAAEIAAARSIPAMFKAYFDFRSEFYVCFASEQDMADSGTAMMPDSNLLEFLSSLSIGYSVADDPNPWLQTQKAMPYVYYGCGILGLYASGLAIPVSLAAIGTAAAGAEQVLKNTLDNWAPTIVAASYNVQQEIGTSQTFRVTVDDISTDPTTGLISGVDYALIRSANPDTSVIVTMEPAYHEQWDGPIGSPTVLYDITINIGDECTLPDGMLFVLIMTARDMQGNSRTKYLDLVIKIPEEELPPPPFIGSMTESPYYIREDRYAEGWKVVIGVTAPFGVNMMEFFITGASSFEHRFTTSDSLQQIGIDSSTTTFQTGMYTIPHIGSLSWIKPGWYHLTVRLWDEADRYDQKTDNYMLYVMPSILGEWRFSNQGSTGIGFNATLYSSGAIAIADCCCYARGWSYINSSRIEIKAYYYDGCCNHFPDGVVQADINIAGTEMIGESYYGPWDATKVINTSAMSAESSPTIIDY